MTFEKTIDRAYFKVAIEIISSFLAFNKAVDLRNEFVEIISGPHLNKRNSILLTLGPFHCISFLIRFKRILSNHRRALEYGLRNRLAGKLRIPLAWLGRG